MEIIGSILVSTIFILEIGCSATAELLYVGYTASRVTPSNKQCSPFVEEITRMHPFVKEMMRTFMSDVFALSGGTARVVGGCMGTFSVFVERESEMTALLNIGCIKLNYFTDLT